MSDSATTPISIEEPNSGAAQQRGSAQGSRIKIIVLLVIVAALAAGFRFLPVAEALTAFLEWVRGYGVWGPVLLGLVYIVATVFMAPGLLLTLGAGYLFGVVAGTVTVSIASVAGATAAFLLGRYAARDFVNGLAENNPKFAAIDSAVAKSGWRIVLLTRLSPLFPFNVINYLYGATKVSLGEYVLASWIGMLPGTVLYVYLGHAAGNLTELLAGERESGPYEQAAFYVGLAATAAVTVVITRIAGRALRQEATVDEPAG